MHGSSLCRMRWFAENWLPADGRLKVLDVGSYDVAGGTYRPFFSSERFDYLGLDLAPGPNVDFVPARAYSWDELADNSFDVVISGQAFEHIEFFWLTAAEMARVLKPLGKMCVIAPRGFERHRHPVDCYRFDADGMLAICRFCGLTPLHATTDMAPDPKALDWHIENCEDSFLIAEKPENWRGIITADTYHFEAEDMEPLANGHVPCQKISPPPAIPLHEHQAAITALQAEIANRDQLIASGNAEIATLRSLVNVYENSNSWRFTKPLRKLRAFLRQCMGRNK